MQHWSDSYINPIREHQYMLRPMLTIALREHILTDTAKGMVGPYDNFLEYWQAKLGHRFFDMPTMVRLGTAMETGLRDFYVSVMGSQSQNVIDLRLPRSRGVFQRLDGRGDTALSRYAGDLGYDLADNEHYRKAQEVMVHRHLYAHRAGLVDDDYIARVQEVMGEDIRPRLEAIGYPEEPVYWWRPLDSLNQYVEDVTNFFRTFPTAAELKS